MIFLPGATADDYLEVRIPGHFFRAPAFFLYAQQNSFILSHQFLSDPLVQSYIDRNFRSITVDLNRRRHFVSPELELMRMILCCSYFEHSYKEKEGDRGYGEILLNYNYSYVEELLTNRRPFPCPFKVQSAVEAYELADTYLRKLVAGKRERGTQFVELIEIFYNNYAQCVKNHVQTSVTQEQLDSTKVEMVAKAQDHCVVNRDSDTSAETMRRLILQARNLLTLTHMGPEAMKNSIIGCSIIPIIGILTHLLLRVELSKHGFNQQTVQSLIEDLSEYVYHSTPPANPNERPYGIKPGSFWAEKRDKAPQLAEIEPHVTTLKLFSATG